MAAGRNTVILIGVLVALIALVAGFLLQRALSDDDERSPAVAVADEAGAVKVESSGFEPLADVPDLATTQETTAEEAAPVEETPVETTTTPAATPSAPAAPSVGSSSAGSETGVIGSDSGGGEG